MGAALTSPVELVLVQRQGSKHFRSAAAEMQGYRNGHEDAHTMACGDGSGAFWVLDGHGGESAALFGAPALKEEFAPLLAANDGTLPDDEVIEKGMVKVDGMIRDHFKEHPNKESGATVVGTLIARQADGTYNLKLINAGDSRALVVHAPDLEEGSAPKCELRTPQHLVDLKSDEEAVKKEYAAKDTEWPLVQETIDHKPCHPTEKARITAAGGFVSDDDPARLDGNLAVSRGLGDFEYKGSAEKGPSEQKVSCCPDIYEIRGLAPGSVACLCCDGVWDVLTSHEVGSMVRQELKQDPDADLGDIAASIVRKALDRNSRDNVTALVVQMTGSEKWVESQPMDEMMFFDKLKVKAGEEGAPDDEVRRHCNVFCEKHNFPRDPTQCDVCSRWYQTMHQCPCKAVHYCSKACQKKAWKTHKQTCAAAPKASTKKK
eukprot:SRR837773.12346.p1 GENE.SRR837773.12346~~SRR837773.12346.p1  ORF type:complete len:432 (-),score=101.05 SRR837773.12346:133-1428(-)